jgi:Fur family ferric uptake transcriptional regulator
MQPLYNPVDGEEQNSVTARRVDDQTDSLESLDQARQTLREHIVRLGLKHSAQRDTILRIFIDTHEHLSTEDLHRLVRQIDPAIGYTTVYRTLKLFVQCGLATVVEFHDGVARYEHGLNRRTHHHMVCTVCGDSVEFFAPEIEKVEQRIGHEFHYVTARHTFQIYGTCPACRQKVQ